MRQYLQYALGAVKYARWITRERLMHWGTFWALLVLVLLAHNAVVIPQAVSQRWRFHQLLVGSPFGRRRAGPD